MTPFEIKTNLLSFQKDAIEKLRQARVGALFADMGTGKSRMAIELARVRAARTSRIIWVCPVSLKLTMEYEILKHTDCTKSDIFIFDNKVTEKTIPMNKRWYIIGIESLSASDRVFLALRRIVDSAAMVICDESTYIKGPAAKRTKRLDLICAESRYRLIMTGTPLTNGEQDLYSQLHFLSPRILGYRSFYSFAAKHLEYSEKYPGKIIRIHNKEFLAAKMAPYVYQITKEECLNLPKKLYADRTCSLSEEQCGAYEEAKEEFLNFHDPEDWTSIEIFRLFTALQSIVCGFWNHKIYELYQDRPMSRPRKRFVRQERLVFKHERVACLMEAVSEIPPNDKVVIWAKFRHSLREIVVALQETYGENCVAEYYGGLSPKLREEEQRLFEKDARFFVGTQAAGGHGLTLTQAHHVIFYANSFKSSERLQAEDRCHRIGQTLPVTYVDVLAACKMDYRIYNALIEKANVLDGFRKEIEKVKRRGGGDKELKELVKKL